MEFIYLDTCLPDYFQGYPEPVLAIPVNGNMTAADFIERIIDTYNIEYDENWPDVNDKEIETAARNLVCVADNTLVFPELERESYDDDYIDSVYCYLAVSV